MNKNMIIIAVVVGVVGIVLAAVGMTHGDYESIAGGLFGLFCFYAAYTELKGSEDE